MTHVVNPASKSHTHTVHYRDAICSVSDNQLITELVDPWVYIATQSVILWVWKGRGRRVVVGGGRGKRGVVEVHW